MKNEQKNISHFNISPLANAGVHVVNMQNEIREEHNISKPHRDNHFLIMLANGGNFKLSIDFKEVSFSELTLLCVFPEQIHHIIEVQKPNGWIISFDPAVVDIEVKELFELRFHSPMFLEPQSDFYLHLTTLLNLIEKSQATIVNKYSSKSIHSLLTAFLYSIACNLIFTSATDNTNQNRSTIIKDTFNQLLKQHYKTWKQPAQYASELAISVSHLNDTVKALTGSSVSIHIQQASILEAKRQLYYTSKSVKEISYEVGYDEPVYFGKLFKKITNLTPLEFRQQFRD
ncbi:AraC family transcriptional regulator [Dyadobacter sp. CY345]|uniref:helix-turn-helix domain-containing protein n=1 Tax=Dyadobacter sp. CY345 TaxID=2909335 RepID=UPI001F239B03|nr:helix-turn-helix domain-containing protein [Dyadobacter sp. CY345]MCF2443969.1 AraC family transcriptional regulator [Dyadobacter sp. CY345]